MIDKKNVTYKKAIELIWLYNQRNAFKDGGIEFICQLPAKNEKEKGGERE